MALVATAGCGFESRTMGTSDGGVDAAIDADPGPGPGPTEVCYGPTGVWRVCLREAPTGQVTLPPTLDTDTSGLCQSTQPVGWTASQPAACFVLGRTIERARGATTRVTGRRPLVLLAHTSILISDVLDYAGHRAANDNPTIASPDAPCRMFTVNPASNNSGGGGAGGSFMTRAGNGGRGGNQAQNGQAAVEEQDPPLRLRGGCPGQAGARLADGDRGAGRGGGAIYLLAGEQIAISGTVNASGAGGTASDDRSGGSGGGSGGMIVLHASSIAVNGNGAVLAKGGGGAGGGLGAEPGEDGEDAPVEPPLRAASGGGNGGEGFPAANNALDGTSGENNNDGGGGGGGGAGYIRANQSLNVTRISPGPHLILDDLGAR
jgi:hypothetical protein